MPNPQSAGRVGDTAPWAKYRVGLYRKLWLAEALDVLMAGLEELSRFGPLGLPFLNPLLLLCPQCTQLPNQWGWW